MKNNEKIKIGGKNKCFIVAEISANHGGKLSNVLKLITKSKEIGADAVKIQTYMPDDITLNCNKKDFLISQKSAWANYGNLWELYNRAQTPDKWHNQIFKHARNIGILIFSSPFSESSVDLLESLDCPIYKLASPEITHIPLIEKIAQTKKPIIISTGLSTKQDIDLAIKKFKKISKAKIFLLKCTTEYPAAYEDVNLKTMSDMKKKFKTDVGLSDHTLGVEIPLGAIAMGASIIEKHICIDKKIKTVDNFFSLDVKEFQYMIKTIRNLEKAIGKIDYDVPLNIKKNLSGRRSIYFSKNITKNDIITKENIKIVRPAYGLHPKFYDKIIGMRVNKNHKIGDRVRLSSVKK